MTTERDRAISNWGRYPPGSGKEYKSDGSVLDVAAWREAMHTIIDSGFINTSLVNSCGDSLAIDRFTNGLRTVSLRNATIHDGTHFFITAFDAKDTNESIIFGVTTPNNGKQIHMNYGGTATSRVEAFIYSGAEISNGTPVTPINNNQRINTPSDIILVRDPTVANYGTVIYSQSQGLEGEKKTSASGASGDAVGNIVLKASTTYLFMVTSKDDVNHISVNIKWIEVEAVC
ncbi:MAG: hypothetical protein WC875_05185 [Candidatus Absconditabacterales bacterium]|jgi:hypothetical protein